jgi:hypothetical protein
MMKGVKSMFTIWFVVTAVLLAGNILAWMDYRYWQKISKQSN